MHTFTSVTGGSKWGLLRKHFIEDKRTDIAMTDVEKKEEGETENTEKNEGDKSKSSTTVTAASKPPAGARKKWGKK
mgnify:CR=1 FL=1